MILTNESQHEYRYGNHGPKYLGKGPFTDFGVVIIQPGKEFDTHMHEKQEEAFFALEGECEVYVNGELVRMKQGDYLQCEPGDAHYFRNTSEALFKAVFIKAPHLDHKDSVYINWRPGQEFAKPESGEAGETQ